MFRPLTYFLTLLLTVLLTPTLHAQTLAPKSSVPPEVRNCTLILFLAILAQRVSMQLLITFTLTRLGCSAWFVVLMSFVAPAFVM